MGPPHSLDSVLYIQFGEDLTECARHFFAREERLQEWDGAGRQVFFVSGIQVERGTNSELQGIEGIVVVFGL